MSHLAPIFQLPAEIRHKIWSIAVGHLDILPFNNPPSARDDPGQSMCIICQKETTPTPAIPHLRAFSPLLACKQLYDEAYPILQKTMTLKITACHLLGTIQSAPMPLRYRLRHLLLYVHLNEGTREVWMSNLTNLHHHFPSLQTLNLHAHLRPPIAYENLIDAIFLCAPLVHLPPSIEQTLHFNYVEDSIMFFREEFGTVYYHDALEEHEKVIRELLADEAFKYLSKSRDPELMTARLLQIAREHEQPWIDSLRAKREREVEGERAEAAAASADSTSAEEHPQE